MTKGVDSNQDSGLLHVHVHVHVYACVCVCVLKQCALNKSWMITGLSMKPGKKGSSSTIVTPMVYGLWFRVKGFWFRIERLGSRAEDFGLRSSGKRERDRRHSPKREISATCRQHRQRVKNRQTVSPTDEYPSNGIYVLP